MASPIMNGDQMEYEREYFNTPLRERPDWPLPSFEARDWAEAFHKRFPSVSADDALGWMANALMRGFDEGRKPVEGGELGPCKYHVLAEDALHALVSGSTREEVVDLLKQALPATFSRPVPA